jgi:polar amino acid transport system ATP-binding protein
MVALLTLTGVEKGFRGTPVLRGVDLTVDEHQVVSLIGPSGCGKSTLLRCINALEVIDAGQIALDGELVSGPGVDVNLLHRQVGIVFQSFNLFPHMSVMSNITLVPRKVLHRSRAQAEATAEAILRRIGLWDKAKEYPDRLSGGQQQRLAIARALAMGPRLLLLDEVTSALDPELVGEVLAIVRELADDGMTMILATHEMAFAREVSDAVCFLDGGRICESGPPEQVLGNPINERTRTFLRRILSAGSLPADISLEGQREANVL